MKINTLNKIITILIVISFMILVFLIGNIIKDLTNKVKETETLDTIDNYSYVLTDSDTDYYKEQFKELKKILQAEEVNEEEYAKTISKLFLIDFYSLASSINKNDVGGSQYVEEAYRDTFIRKAKDTIYANVENNIYGDRKQELPNVTQVEITKITKTKTGYETQASITYDKELGYAKKVILTLTKKENILEISSLKENS
ncbi:MAG: hypothetical protein MR388_04770 [Tenericutes bacterium]|nr:hypothetical protein [Mycoplasmatota bacterium]